MDMRNYSRYAYKADLKLVFSDSTFADISENIVNIVIKNHYERYVFPVIFVRLYLNVENFTKIQNDNGVKLNLNMRKYREDDVSNNDLMKTVIYTDYINNLNLVPIKKNITPISVDDKLYNNTNNPQSNFYMDLILMTEDSLNINKMVFNGIYRNCSVVELMALMVKYLNKDVLIERPDNASMIDQAILIPDNFINNIRYINDVYGIYKSGLRMFFGFDQYYILSGLINAKTPRSLKDDVDSIVLNIQFSEVDVRNRFYNHGSFEDGNKRIITTTEKNVFIGDDQILKNELTGTNNYFMSQSEGFSLNHTKLDSDINKTKVFKNKYSNPYKEEEYRLSNKNYVSAVYSFSDIDIDLLGCNKLFNFNFMNLNYVEHNGYYQMIESFIVFEVDNKDNLVLKGKATFKKIG